MRTRRRLGGEEAGSIHLVNPALCCLYDDSEHDCILEAIFAIRIRNGGNVSISPALLRYLSTELLNSRANERNDGRREHWRLFRDLRPLQNGQAATE